MSNEISSLETAIRENVVTDGMMGAETSAEQLDMLRDDDGRLPDNIFQEVRRRGAGRPRGSGNKLNKKIASIVVHKFGDPVMELANIGFMPLDQLTEIMLVATGNSKVEEKLITMADELIDRIKSIKSSGGSRDEAEIFEDLADKVFNALSKYSVKPGDLAEKALKIKRQALSDVSNYVHSKQPIAVDMTRHADVILNIPGLTDTSALAEHVETKNVSPEQLQNLVTKPWQEDISSDLIDQSSDNDHED